MEAFYSAVTRASERAPWPEPEKSVGKCYRDLGRGKRCWEAIGSAREVADQICEDIRDLLTQREEHLCGGEKEKYNLGFGVYMVGRKKEKARPTIIVHCPSPNICKKAVELIKEKGPLGDHPSIRVGSLLRAPELVGDRAGMTEMRQTELLGSSEQIDKDAPTVLVLDKQTNPCGALISIETPASGSVSHQRRATMGGVLLIDGEYYGLTAQHVNAHDFMPNDPPGNNGDQLILEDGSDWGDDEDIEDASSGEETSGQK